MFTHQLIRIDPEIADVTVEWRSPMVCFQKNHASLVPNEAPKTKL
jgi:hypothetical protein